MVPRGGMLVITAGALASQPLWLAESILKNFLAVKELVGGSRRWLSNCYDKGSRRIFLLGRAMATLMGTCRGYFCTPRFGFVIELPGESLPGFEAVRKKLYSKTRTG